ncbi:MAG: hypothetical protein WCO66_05135 [Candidatus Absconditabacteria bacterium]
MTVDQFLEQFQGLDPVAQRIQIFEAVRDFPYQINGKTTAEELLEAKEGYCAAKHKLLKECYTKLGYETELCFTPFMFRYIYLPEHLRDRGLANKKIYHSFLRLKMNDARISIDATFHPAMRDVYVVNENRDGISDQKDICPYSNVSIARTPEEEREIKQELSEALDSEDERWIEEYNAWIKTIGKD